MSFFNKIFGGKEKDEGPTPGEAIQKLRETEEMLYKKQEFLEKKIEEYTLLAKKNASKNKRGTVFLYFTNFKQLYSLNKRNHIIYIFNIPVYKVIDLIKFNLYLV